MAHNHPQTRARFAGAATAGAALLALTVLAGCAADNPMQGALRGSIANPFGGPSEDGFRALVRKHCGSELVGGQSVASLMDSDTTFRQLTGRLYRGDISNDGFMNQVLQEHPAADANIPATGCVVNQLDTCFNTRCDGRAAQSADTVARQEIDATRDASLDELPAADAGAVDAMVDGTGAAGMDDIGPLPSETTMDVAPEGVEKIEEPGEP
jgi:hypothetical protein